MNNVLKFLIVFCITILLSGCGIKDRLKFEAKSAQNDFLLVEKNFLNQSKKYEQFKNSPEYKDFEFYAVQEKWQNNFNKIPKMLNVSKKISNEISVIVENNDSDDQEKLKKLFRSLKEKNIVLKKENSYVFNRINFIKNTKQNADSLYKKAQNNFRKSKLLYTNIKKTFVQTKKDYPKKSIDLTNKENKLKKMIINNKKFILIINEEYSKDTSKVNYALFGDTYEHLSSNSKLIKNTNNTFQKSISELHRSYSKILTDMKSDYYVVVRRSTWDNYAEYGKEHIYTHLGSKVTPKVYEYFDTLKLDEIASFNTGWSSGKSIKIDMKMWKALKIRISIPRNDNAGVWWVSLLYKKGYHKYTIVENDKKQTSDWIEVSNLMYDNNVANLSMEIVSKPFGFYEEEKITKASPVGMSLVDNPKYGEWREQKNQSSGSSGLFWYFFPRYGFYSSYMGPRYYHYDDYTRYRGYRTRNQSYYGRNHEYGTWGSSTYSNNRYSSSNYAQTNAADVRAAKSGKGSQVYKRSSSSVRGSGSSARGRGPGGGGK